MCRSLGLTKFTTVDMRHGTRCYGVVLKHSDGWSIAYVCLSSYRPFFPNNISSYSADTVPCDNLVLAGQNASLLIHEASMADDQEALAAVKQHSTFSQALDVGRR